MTRHGEGGAGGRAGGLAGSCHGGRQEWGSFLLVLVPGRRELMGDIHRNWGQEEEGRRRRRGGGGKEKEEGRRREGRAEQAGEGNKGSCARRPIGRAGGRKFFFAFGVILS